MTNWLVYGKAWFTMTVDGNSEADAKMSILNKLMELEGMKIDVKELEAELANG